MMVEITLGKLHQLKLSGMAEALSEQSQSPLYGELAFEERLGMLVDREMTHRDNRRLTNLLRGAKLRYASACPEEIDFRTPRGLAKDAILSLTQNGWVKGKQNVIVTGPTGSGKTFIACARADGSYGKLLSRLAKYAILIIDDWGLAKLGDKERRDILEVLEDRHGITSTIVVSQIPTEKWHDTIGDPTIADAVLDRLVHNAHRITMKGESMRKLMSKSK